LILNAVRVCRRREGGRAYRIALAGPAGIRFELFTDMLAGKLTV
jgi:hypothetical protein